MGLLRPPFQIIILDPCPFQIINFDFSLYILQLILCVQCDGICHCQDVQLDNGMTNTHAIKGHDQHPYNQRSCAQLILAQGRTFNEMMYQRVWHHADQSVYTHNIIIIVECRILGDSQGSCMHEWWFTLHDVMVQVYIANHGMIVHFCVRHVDTRLYQDPTVLLLIST